MSARSPTLAHVEPSASYPPDWAGCLARHDRWLRAVILVRSGEPQAVDEIMQEVSLAAVEQRSPLRQAEKLASWLYRLAVIKSIRFRRSQARYRQPWLLREERRQQVRAALARLPGRDAEILLLKYQERWSYRQIASLLGISESAVDTRLHRARERLRKSLEIFSPQEAPP
jgi:RNA polymerase sigma-70 factor (ECF subfamily)